MSKTTHFTVEKDGKVYDVSYNEDRLVYIVNGYEYQNSLLTPREFVEVFIGKLVTVVYGEYNA